MEGVGQRAEALLLPADRADGVRLGLEGHAELGGDGGNGPRRELEVKPLQQSGEKEEHLHPGQLLSQALTLPWEKKKEKEFPELDAIKSWGEKKREFQIFATGMQRLTQRERQEGLAPHEVAVGVQKPLRQEDPRIVPVLLVKVHRVEVRDHHGPLGNGVAVHVGVLGGGAENPERDDVAEAEDLVQDGLHVRHLLLVLQRGHPPVGQDAVDLPVHSLFEVGMRRFPDG